MKVRRARGPGNDDINAFSEEEWSTLTSDINK